MNLSKTNLSKTAILDAASNIGSGVSRRQFIKYSSGLLAAMSAPAVLARTSSVQGHGSDKGAMMKGMHKSAVGLQLYTLRDIMKVSVPATLKLVADVGYSEMEFAGYFDHSAKEIKQLLDDNGLTAPSAHIQLDAFDTNLTQILDDAQTVGHKYLVVPWLSEAQRGTGIAPYQALADKLNTIGEACKKEGITLAYHNHDFEFEVRDGKTPLDVLITQTDPDLVAMELDLYWTVKAGKNPVDYFKQYPGRFKLWHVKDMAEDGSFADVGTGTINFKEIFAHGKLAGIEHKFVERDQTTDRIATIEQGFKAVSALNKGVS
ncbi:sugar phosphate isomerase/epimerase [Alteromonas sp. Cnat3-28]|uniref:sugar phosphate isomerase/epimerase family protein n=1 Tax=Alteromonas sp. Cnat3-28 TaxID=2917729 RepID=UPI001EF7225A|nr:sugar phosphate isomerase/epimerase [Alteromonas sp. Cnat3-28]